MNGFNEREYFALSAAEGWLMLGCPAEAEHELKTIRAENLNSSEVLGLRWAVNFRGKRWEAARSVAKVWCWRTPETLEAWIALANSTREFEGLGRAKQILLDTTRRFPREWVVPYNLACFCAQLGEIAEAVLWLNKALSLDTHQKMRKKAAADPDLAPLWQALSEAALKEEVCSEE